jgi:hypothetical protein
MKYFSLASVALLGAATVSAGPLGIREDIGQCPKGYTMSVYYKTIYPESTASATVESTVAPSSTAALVQSVNPVAAVEVFSSTTSSSAPAETTAAETTAVETTAAKTTAAEAAVAQTSAVESAAVINLISPSSIETTAAAETTAAPVVAQVPTSSVETTTAAENTAAAVIAQIPTISAEAAAVEATAAPVVKAVSTTSTTSSTSSGENSGSATFYGGNVSGGTCSFSSYTLPSTLFGTALSADRWDNAANCGSCVSVTGPNGKTIKAMVSLNPEHEYLTPQNPKPNKPLPLNRSSTNAPNAKATTWTSSSQPSPNCPTSLPA